MYGIEKKIFTLENINIKINYLQATKHSGF